MNRWIPTAAALVAAAVFAVPAIRHWREQPPPPPPVPQTLRASWIAPGQAELGAGGDYVFGLALAADGRQLVYPATTQGIASLWLQDLRTGESRTLAGTEGAAMPFWATDQSRIGFFSGGKLRSLDVASRMVSDLADAPAPRGAAWNSNGDLIFAPSSSGGLMRRDSKGAITTFTTLDPSSGETAHAWPAFTADGAHVIFLVTSTQPARSGLWIATLDHPSDRKRILASDSQAIVVANTLLYLRDLSLVAQPLDAATFEPSGRSATIGSPAGRGPLAQLFATASTDVLIYGAPGSNLRELKWVLRSGEASGSSSEPVDAWDLRIAPDGRRVVVTEVDRQLRTLDVFIRNGAQPAATRLSLSTDADESGVWSPDGLRIAWAGQRRKVMLRGAGAVLPEQTIATFDLPVQVWDWSHDGRSLLIGRTSTTSGGDLWVQPPTEGATAQPYVAVPFDQVYGAFSPDGRAIAYASNESGQFDIYVDAYPRPGTRVRVTAAGGTEPRWSADGRELYFRRGSEIHAATLDRFEVRSTAKLFDAGATIRAFDVSRDGRFLLNLPANNHASSAATIVSHWSAFADTPPRDKK